MAATRVPVESERQFQAAVRKLAETLGWLVYCVPDSRRCPAGYPDLTLIHRVHGAMWRELKTEKGRLRPEQRHYLETMRAASLDADVWRPSDWDRIVRELRGEGARCTRNAQSADTEAGE